MPALRSRQPRRFPAARPHDPVIRLCWSAVEPNEAILSALQALARDTAYIGHSASLTRCRFLVDGGALEWHATKRPERGVYQGRLEELRQAYVRFEKSANKKDRPQKGVRIPPEPEAKVTRTNLFGAESHWMILEHVSGDMPDVRACALVAKTLRDALLSGYRRIGLGDNIPEVVSGHTADRAPTRAGESRELERPLVLVATQCIEAGVDIDLDALITEAAPVDSLRQRFGRLNRAGRDIKPYAAIVADRTDISARADDPVYGKAIKLAWDYLGGVATKENSSLFVDFGIEKMNALTPPDHNALTEKPDAPVLLPAHLDLLSETSPIPATDPDVALYLHGPARQPDSVTIIWRADIVSAWEDQDLIRLLAFIPPRSPEAIELPVWTVRRWLEGRGKWAVEVADIPMREPDAEEGRNGRRVFRWKGDDARSQWISPSEVRPGDTIIVPASYGGVDAFGWDPECKKVAQDVAHKAAEPFARKKFAVRVAPGLTGQHVSDDALAGTLASLRAENPETVRQTLLNLDLPAEVRNGLAWLGEAKGWRGKPRVVIDFDLYGENEKREPRGVVLLAPFGVRFPEARQVADHGEDGGPNSTEDDIVGSVFSFPLSLDQHSRDVEGKARELAKRAGLPADLRPSAWPHSLSFRKCGRDASAPPSWAACPE